MKIKLKGILLKIRSNFKCSTEKLTEERNFLNLIYYYYATQIKKKNETRIE
jgi:hypothetical protein